MFQAVYWFFTDYEFFRATMKSLRAGNRLRGLIGTAGILVTTGVIPLDALSDSLGEVGHYIGIAAIALAFFVRSDGTAIDLTNMTEAQIDALREHMRSSGILAGKPPLPKGDPLTPPPPLLKP